MTGYLKTSGIVDIDYRTMKVNHLFKDDYIRQFGDRKNLNYSKNSNSSKFECLFQNIPEGISMSIPMKTGGMKATKVIFYVILSGITTGVGAFFGAIVGSISEQVISICLSFAAGAMLYIVSGELIPESNILYHGRMTSIGNILGFLIGIFATKL